MNIVIGKIVNTFGIKGELKIVSNFEMANRAFKKGNKIIINNKERLITNSRFHHHNYLVEIDNIKNLISFFSQNFFFFHFIHYIFNNIIS